MNQKNRPFLFSLALVLALLFSAILPIAAYADDTAPPQDPAPENTPIDSPPAAGTIDQVVAPATADEGAPAADPAEAGTPDVAPTAEATPAATAETVSLPEVLDQAPAATAVVVLDKSGESLPLATAEAEAIVATGDPMWCPGTTDPGGPGCTASTPTFNGVSGLLAVLAAGSYTGAGVIYVQNTTFSLLSEGGEVVLDHTATGLSGLGALTIQGGWDGFNGPPNIVGVSTFSVPFTITNWTADVTLNDLVITANDPFAALDVVTTGGAINANNLTVSGNATGTGANLDSCGYNSMTGLCAGTGAITVNGSTFDNNHFDGLATDAGGATTLNGVQAASNGLHGADMIGADDDGTGNITVNGGIFNNNVNGSGLDIVSDSDVTLNGVTADGNNDGAVLNATLGNGDIAVNGGQFNSNDFDGVNAGAYGDITLDGIDASMNLFGGADLETFFTGNISVINGSTFTQNSAFGVGAVSEQGDIALKGVVLGVLVDGNGVTETGALLATVDGGNILVQNSTFTDTTGAGLLAVSSGGLDLNNVTATLNGSDGAQAYSTYTFTCYGPNDIVVNVNGGTYQNNGGYGLYVAPGAGGALNFVTPPTFGGNFLGDFLLDPNNPDCSGDKDGEQEEPYKDYNVVDVPFTGGDPVPQDCDLFAGNILQLPDGTLVKFDCPFDGSDTLSGLNETDLPGTLGAGADFVAGLLLGLLDPNQATLTINPDGSITVSFLIPEGSHGRSYDILYWDPTANSGAGAWVTLPQPHFGLGAAHLNPNDPTDGRLVRSGVSRSGNSVSVTVNFTGVFVLVSR